MIARGASTLPQAGPGGLPIMLYAIPLTILPWIAFNVVAFIFGYDVWDRQLFSVTMISGQVWGFFVRDLMVLFGLLCVFFEVLRSASSGTRMITNHILSTIVFILFLVEFIVVRIAAHSIFFILMAIALFDVIAGFTIAIRTAQRSVTYTRDADGERR
jgi:hypothetical protein